MSEVYDSAIPELERLSESLGDKTECLASGSRDLQDAALTATKRVFDICKPDNKWLRPLTKEILAIQSEQISNLHISNLLSSLDPSEAPQTRSQARIEKAKPMSNLNIGLALTPLSSLFIENMDDEQIWAQLDLRTKAVCSLLELALEGETEDGDDSDSDSEPDARLRKAMEDLEASEGLDFEALREEMDVDGDDFTGNLEEDEEAEEEELSDDDLGEAVVNLHDSSSDRDAEMDDTFLMHRRKKSRKGASELDDGFFDLSTFNAETEQAEARSSSKGRLGTDSDSDSDSEMSVDLFARVDERDLDEDDLEDDSHGK